MTTDFFELIILVLAFGLGAWLYRFFLKLRSSRRMERIRVQGREGELKAKVALEEMGFEIIDEQARLESEIEVDGDKVPYRLICDYIVEKEGVRSIVEVKTGSKAPDPSTSATRRQLLEYAVSYSVDSIKLFDADRGMLKEVRFPFLDGEGQALKEERELSLKWIIPFFMFGALVGYLLSFFFSRS